MHIKQIIIQGFRSYKDQTVIEPFSPDLNVIVGRNGSGKSNFFAAIRFVLSDAYTQMSREERQALLHEGSGSAVLSAYVEIIFDNSDERFPTGRPELTLRRSIGLKKDEYSLDRKNSSRNDVMNLLESAGFSRSNPYYIVPQGRVTVLTNMKDAERLQLLKEVAGTRVYETRREESVKIINETDNKRGKIDDLLKYIKERLDELEEDKKELKEFQESDRKRRCLEYTIYSREQNELTKALNSIDDQRQTGVDQADENREKSMQIEQQVARIDTQIGEAKRDLDLVKLDKSQLEGERRDTARKAAKVELDLKAAVDSQSSVQAMIARNESQRETLLSQITQKETELEQILPRYNAKMEEESQLRTRLSDLEGTRNRLYAKQGRTTRFTNQRQRDQWLQKEIDEVEVALGKRKSIASDIRTEVAELDKDVGEIKTEIDAIKAQLDSRDEHLRAASEEIYKAKEQRDFLMDRRKELWREEAKLDSVIDGAQHEQSRAERYLSDMMDRNTSRGLASVRRLKTQLKLTGLHGTLAELFEVSDRYRTAVEITAGASLFHYVVDTDVTASKVMELLQKEKGGRVTFMPLNRLRQKPVTVPNASDAIHMISKLKYEPKFEAAFQHVFGRTIICPNLQIASQYARSYGVSAITPEGDRADKKGALTGGYHDSRRSRLEAIGSVSKFRDAVESQKSRASEIRRELQVKDQEITRAVGELQKVEHNRSRLENSYGPLTAELRVRNQDLQAKTDQLEEKKRAERNVVAAITDLEQQESSYQKELTTPYAKSLTGQEEEQLQQLNTVIQDLQKRLGSESVDRSELEERKTTLEVELRENLRLKLDQLNAELAESGPAKGSTRLREMQQDLDRVNVKLESISEKLHEAEQSIDQSTAKVNELEQSKAEKQLEQEGVLQAIQRHQKRVEKNMAKKAILAEKATECNRNIRDLGTLPDDAFNKHYQKIKSDDAIKQLHRVNDALKKYSHVNKKAFEQYANFTRQRDTLNKRRAELDSSHESIEDLINVLDLRKDEAIERTFKQVSREFANVFEKLVPAGKGRLIIQKKSDRVIQGRNQNESEDEGKENVENYTGVSISVSFNSKHDEQQRIQQLSGGQKSLCALALVFAIQACDPAPFYLFDEIDANLDAQYRAAVAQLLKEISERGEGGQFICTTFRSEMVLVAKKCYGVTYSHKTSNIDVVDRDQALSFVEGQKP